MNSRLTIILTLKDRPLFTKRWMSYMNDMRCPYKILIADGGKDQSIEENLRDHRNYPYLNYEYVRYPYDSSREVFYQKRDDIISQVETPYVLIADNDDFYLLDRVPEILDTLDNDKDIVGARGRHVNFTVYDVNQQKNNNNVNGTHYLAITNEIPSIDANTSVERIEELCGNMSRYDYYMNWYCVFRAEAVKTAWKNILDIKVKEAVFVEIFLGIFLVERGKIVVLPFDFYLRQSGTSDAGDKLVKGNDFLERCISVDGFSDFKTLVEKFLVSLNENQKDRLFKAIAGWLQVFIVNVYIGNVRIYRLKRFNAFLRYVKRLPYIGYFATVMYWYSFNVFSRFRKRRVIKIKKIENYILK
jgi:glycosyltransferase domain-containing protein